MYAVTTSGAFPHTSCAALPYCWRGLYPTCDIYLSVDGRRDLGEWLSWQVRAQCGCGALAMPVACRLLAIAPRVTGELRRQCAGVKWLWDTADSPVGLSVSREHSTIWDLRAAPPGAVLLSGVSGRLCDGMPSEQGQGGPTERWPLQPVPCAPETGRPHLCGEVRGLVPRPGSGQTLRA